MDLLKKLKFVSGAVSNSAVVTEMNHFAIEHGHIRATNGIISMGCPVDFPVNCAPNAPTLRKALTHCEDVLSMSMAAGERLLIKSGKFRAFVPCVDLSTLPHPKPSGMPVDYNGELLRDAFEKLHPFVSKDALHPWATGVLLRGPSAFATNNACLAECWVGVEAPVPVNIPLLAIKEVLRIKDAPARVMMDDYSITFMYEDGRWIKSQLLETEWPNLSSILNKPSNPTAVPAGLFEAVRAVSDFTGETRAVRFIDGHVCSGGGTAEGAAYEVEGLPDKGVYRSSDLLLLEGVATSVDFDQYPQAALFFGGNLRGAVVGLAR